MNRNLLDWNFLVNNDDNVNLVLKGIKNCMISLDDKNNLPHEGDEAVLIYDNEKQACVTRVNKVTVTEFKNVTDDLKAEYKDYLASVLDNFNDDTLVTVVNFDMVDNLVESRLNLAKSIVDANRDLFGDEAKVREINAGFNNSIFDVDGKYVIKVCGNSDKENLFDIEVNYYQANEDNEVIPKLYRYDKSKSIVPYCYEIIECVNGKSVYYYWYKWNESERENFIKRLMDLITKMHDKEYSSFDWAAYVKGEVLNKFNQSLDLLTEDEQSIILKSLELYDEVLADNYFTLIHNDLHFDNILISDNGKIKIIDFNDSMVAPFDYDMRIFYMMVNYPWKWANSEMDPYQKSEDYVNIFEYVKKYYSRLKEIKYLDERMIIYSVLDDIRHLPRFKNMEDKEKVINNSKKLINRFQS